MHVFFYLKVKKNAKSIILFECKSLVFKIDYTELNLTKLKLDELEKSYELSNCKQN